MSRTRSRDMNRARRAGKQANRTGEFLGEDFPYRSPAMEAAFIYGWVAEGQRRSKEIRANFLARTRDRPVEPTGSG